MLRSELARPRHRFATATATAVFAALAMAAAWTTDANAQTNTAASTPDMARIMRLIEEQESRLDAQERILRQQQEEIGAQRTLIERQRTELAALQADSDLDLSDIRGAGAPTAMQFALLEADQPIAVNRNRRPMQATPAQAPQPPPQTAPAAPAGPVGEAPPEEAVPRTTVEALPEGASVLPGRGRWTIEPSVDYTNASNDRLVFRGAVIENAIQIGLIEANDTRRDTITTSVSARYQLTDRLEIEGRLPWVYRSDRVTTLVAAGGSATQTSELTGSGIGDAEVSARYQLNNGASGLPIFVASARYKADTGVGSFDVARDNAGVATELATGSGFWGVQGGVSMLYATDPAVIFASASYLYNAPRDIGKQVGSANIGEVDPGDSVSFGLGFGFALNDRFSYSLSYAHSTIFETETEINNSPQTSTMLQVGVLQLGLSYRLNDRVNLSTSFDVGVTEDAPDVRVSFRTPFRF